MRSASSFALRRKEGRPPAGAVHRARSRGGRDGTGRLHSSVHCSVWLPPASVYFFSFQKEVRDAELYTSSSSVSFRHVGLVFFINKERA
jgi:hypothetical protein